MADDGYELLQIEEFLNLVSQGTPELNAALEVDWRPKKLKAMLADPEFAALVDAAKSTMDGKVEQVLGQMALNGHFLAIQMWLYNRDPGRWKDVKKIQVDSTVTHNVALVGVAKEAALAMLKERGAIGLQAFHAIETTARDADD